MALTDNPYLPLYVKDWMTSNKLKLCSANAHGIMINVMCLMHRQNEYGTILLKQNFKQTTNQILNFACLLAKLTPFSEKEISAGLTELIEEKCLIIDGDFLKCLRMINDAKLSELRKSVGSKGGNKTAKKFATPKRAPNTGNAIDSGNGNETEFITPKEYLEQKISIDLDSMAAKSGLDLEDFENCLTQWSLKCISDNWQYSNDANSDLRRLRAGFEKWLNSWSANLKKNPTPRHKSAGKQTAIDILTINELAKHGISED